MTHSIAIIDRPESDLCPTHVYSPDQAKSLCARCGARLDPISCLSDTSLFRARRIRLAIGYVRLIYKSDWDAVSG